MRALALALHVASQISGEQGISREHKGAYIGLERTEMRGIRLVG